MAPVLQWLSGPACELLRQPLEDGLVAISRAQGAVTYPAKFVLVGAMNPCPCGFYGDPVRQCTCSAAMVTKYQKRLSGPLLDRIDIHVEVPRVAYDRLASDRTVERSAEVRRRTDSPLRPASLRATRSPPPSPPSGRPAP